jgi:hypothetical protein
LGQARRGYRDAGDYHPAGSLISDPGMGKTTLLRWLARICATGKSAIQERLGWAEGELTPVLLSLAVFADARKDRPNLSLRSFLDQELTEQGGDALRTAINEELVEGRAFLLIDGVDEVCDSCVRSQVVRAVDRFIAEHARNRCLVTSRRYGYIRLGGQVEHFEMASFDQEQLESFTYRWQRGFEHWKHPSAPNLAHADAEAEAMLSEIVRSPKIRELAANPLMLAIISLIRCEGRRLPEQRVQFYERAVRTLMDTWNQWRSLADFDVNGEQLATDRLIRVWGTVAEWMWRTQPTGVVHRAELERKLVQILKEKELDDGDPGVTAASYLNSAAARAGLLEEREKDIFAFWHPTFEEFLAAVELATPTSKAIDRILAVRDDPHWREVILLAVGYVGIVLRDDETATALVEALATQSLAPTERLFHRGLRLAAACIADDVGIRRPLARRIVVQLAEVVREWPLADPSGSDSITWKVPSPDSEGPVDGVEKNSNSIKTVWVRVMRWPYQQFNVEFFRTVTALPRLRLTSEEIATIAPLADRGNDYVRMSVALLCSNVAASNTAARDVCRKLVEDSFDGTVSLAALGPARSMQFDEQVLRGLVQADELDYTEPVRDFLANEISQEAVNHVIALLGSSDPNLRLQAALLLLRVGQAETQAADTLVSLLNSGDDPVRIVASEKLRKIGCAESQVVGTLQELLTTKRKVHSVDASETQVERLQRELLTDKDLDIALRAARLLVEKGMANECTVQNSDFRYHVSGIELRYKVGCTDESDIETLYMYLDLFVDPDLDAAKLLWQMGRADKRVGDRLITALKQGGIKPHRVPRAMKLLESMGQMDQTLGALQSGIGAEDRWLRLRCAEALMLLGRLDEAGIEGLMSCLNADDPDLCVRAADLLDEIGVVDEDVLASVAKIVKSDFVNASAAFQRVRDGEPSDEHSVDSLVELFRLRMREDQGDSPRDFLRDSEAQVDDAPSFSIGCGMRYQPSTTPTAHD